MQCVRINEALMQVIMFGKRLRSLYQSGASRLTLLGLSVCLVAFLGTACAPKEVVRRAEIGPYEGPVTVEILKGSVGFGEVKSIKALADVTISKRGETQGSLNGVLGYKAPGKMRINLFGPFGLTVTEILMTEALLQLYVPPRNTLYEWKSPEVTFTGLRNSGFRYEIGEEGDMYILRAYKSDALSTDVAAKYFFDRTYLLNRSIRFYKDGTEVLRAEFNDFNNRIPERTKVSFSNGLLMEISMEEPEFDADIPDEYFKVIEHGDKQIKPFQEVFKRFAPIR